MRPCQAVFDPTNVQDGLIKVDLLPPKIDKLGCAQPMPEREQDHRHVPVALPVVFGHRDEALDLGRRQMFAGSQFPVRSTPGRAIKTVRFSGSGLTSSRRGVTWKSFGSGCYLCVYCSKPSFGLAAKVALAYRPRTYPPSNALQ